jgi:chemosensory pili system protein ChpA (sensor histidine kinase/response regulator)
VRPGSADVFVYRDTSTPEEDLAAAAAAEREAAERLAAERAAAQRAAAEREAAYWYGPAEPVSAPGSAGEARGPFEPLVTSETGPAAPGSAISEADEPEEPGDRHAQKLAQIKDFYLTAEAIGEHNVDKHFDQLLAQQRELISQYFKDAAVRRSDASQVEVEHVDENEHADEPTEASAAQADVAW